MASWPDLYGDLGWSAFLIPAGSKFPRGPWQTMATDDAETLHGWARSEPSANVGIVVPDGWIVVDIDPGAEGGIDAVRERLPADTPTSTTPRGGYHVWMCLPYGCDGADLVQRSIARGVDVRLPGKGYLLEYPSRTGAGRYSWTLRPDSADGAECPAWVIDALAARGPVERPDLPLAPLDADDRARAQHYVMSAVAAELDRASCAAEGERQTALFAAACAIGRYVAGGYLDPGEMRISLHSAAKSSGLLDEDGAESVDRQIDRGFAEGALDPRRVDVPQMAEFQTAQTPDLSATPLWVASDLEADESPREAALIEPGILYPSDLAVVAGPPKSQKSMAVLDIAIKTGQGESWGDCLRVERPIRWLIVNYEMRRDMMRGRVQAIGGAPDGVVITPRGMGPAGPALYTGLAARYESEGWAAPDVVVLDTFAHAYGGDENDNAGVHRWITTQREELARVWPGAALMLVHHTRKLGRAELKDDPFSALRGATSLRGAYDLGIVVSKVEESSDVRRMWFESRGSPSTPGPLNLLFGDGGFKVDDASAALALGDTRAEKAEAFDVAKAVRVQEILILEAAEGRVYTAKGFASKFARRDNLPGANSLREFVREMSFRGLLAYVHGGIHGAREPHSKSWGHVVCEGLEYDGLSVGPTHYLDPQTERLTECGAGWRYAGT